MPPQYFEQLVTVPLQYFQRILGLTKWVPPQYLTPSYGPATYSKFEHPFMYCLVEIFLIG